MRIMVTGGAGYIGSHAVRALARRGHEPVIYDNLSRGHARCVDGFELIVADLSDRHRLTAALRGVDAIMHFAAFAYVGESIQNPSVYFRNNVVGGLALLDAAVDAGVRKFVFSSSCAVYGIPAMVPIPEHLPRTPISPYGACKLFLEQALEAYSHAYGLQSVWLRYFNVAGADEECTLGEWHDPEPHLIPLALRAAARIGPELEIYGTDYSTPDGTCIRDFVHVCDLASAHVLAIEYMERGGDTGPINVGTGQGHSIKQVLDVVKRVTGREVPHRYGPRRPGDPAVLIADASRAELVLGFKASQSIEDAVRTAWNYVMKNRGREARLEAGSYSVGRHAVVEAKMDTSAKPIGPT